MMIWTVGTGGLLGTAITRRAVRNGMSTFTPTPMPWGEKAEIAGVVDADARAFAQQAEDEPWAVLWAAGSARSATDSTAASGEIRALEAVLEALARHRPAGRGAFFVASSAGALHAGAEASGFAQPPFADRSPVRPVTAYGRLKLAEEALAGQRLADVCPVVIGRLANLYGPGQNLTTVKGVIPRLVLGALTQRPVLLSVPLESIRDYVDADDAAMLALHWTANAAAAATSGTEVKVIASGQPITVASLVHLTRNVTGQQIRVVVNEPTDGQHPLDLRLVPSQDAASPSLIRTPLPAGIRRVHADLEERLRQAVTRSGRPLVVQLA